MRFNAVRYVLVYFLAAYVVGLIVKSADPELAFLRAVPPGLLLALNALSILAGLPVSLLFDLVLIRFYGIQYLVAWPVVVGLASAFQVWLFRGIGETVALRALIKKQVLLRRSFSRFSATVGSNLNAFVLILFVRAIPVLPFAAASMAIATSSVGLVKVFSLSVIGSYFYYLVVFFGFKLGFSFHS